MLLAFDVGNTNIVVGVFSKGKLLTRWRLETEIKKSADEYGITIDLLFRHEGFDPKDIDDVIISSVVPSLLFTLQHLCYKYFDTDPIIVASGIKTGLKIEYDDPRQVGADRIVNAVAAYAKYGGPVIIIDFGTATTFCAVSENLEYLGGTIAPGIKISSAALFEETSKLPNVDLEIPGKVIGKNTTESMQAGLIYGHMGVVEFIVNKMKKELVETYGKNYDDIKVVATGGLATMIMGGVDCVDYLNKRLTLEGLSIIYEKNKTNRLKGRFKNQKYE